MRRFLLCFVLGLLVSGPALADQASALADLRSRNGVVDTLMDTSGNLYVYVKPQPNVQWGSFAMRVCQIVRPHQARIFRVRVVDLTKVNPHAKPDTWPRLGDAACG